MIDDIRKVPNVRKTTFIKKHNSLNRFIQGDSYSQLLFNLYIITDNFETFPCASLIKKLAVLCVIFITSECLPSSPYIIHLEVDLFACNNILVITKQV